MMDEVISKIQIGRLYFEILRGYFSYMQIGYDISYGKRQVF
jgi:hypothetical protein